MRAKERERRVLLLSHHGIIRAGLKYILAQAAERFDVGEAEDARGAMQQLSRRDWDLVIVDFSADGELKLDLIRQAAGRRDGPGTLIISPAAGENLHLKRGLEAGAGGCLHWDELVTDLLMAMEWLHRGERYIAPRLGASLLDVKQTGKRPHERLSQREYQVFWGLIQGKRTGEIAEEMSLSPKTVYAYRKRIEDKTALRTNADFVRYGRRQGLL